jgi:heptosyltransferase-2
MKINNRQEINKILVISPTGVGENIIQIPFLRTLKKIFPQAKVTMVLRFEDVINLLSQLELVDDFIVCDYARQDTLIKKIKLISDIRKEKYDISFLTFPSSKFDKLLFSKLCQAKLKIGHQPQSFYKLFAFCNDLNIKVDMHLHDVEQNLTLLQEFSDDLSRINKEIELAPTETAIKKADELLKQSKITDNDVLIGMHSGSSKAFNMDYKRWPIGRYLELAAGLIEKNKVKIINFKTSEDPNLYIERKKQEIVNIEASLDIVLALLSRCKLFIGNDTAVMHLAAASGIRVIGIFGPTDPIRTAPFSKKAEVIRSSISCSPCYGFKRLGQGIRCPYGRRKCLEEISVSQVFDAVNNALMDKNPNIKQMDD